MIQYTKCLRLSAEMMNMLVMASNAGEEDRTYITLVKDRNCAAILGTEKVGEISIPFIWGLRVHKLCSLLRLQ